MRLRVDRDYMRNKNQDQSKILINGAELVELKRHAHEIPECPGLDKRLQKYKGDKPFLFTDEELGWIVSVLNAVLNDPKGYACIEQNPFKLEYVPTSDERCKTCMELYGRLRCEENNIWESRKKEYLETKIQEQKYFDDDGTEINPDLIPKPDLCISCKNDGLYGKEEILCNLTRADQQGEDEFICEAYE